MLIVDRPLEIVAEIAHFPVEPVEYRGIDGFLIPQPLDDLNGERQLHMLDGVGANRRFKIGNPDAPLD